MKADFEKGTKVCSKCKRELPVSEFNKNKRNKDGIDNKCRQCASEYYKNNKEHVKTKVREYRMTEKGKYKTKRTNPHGLLIWYDGKLNNITTEEYRTVIAREYTIQKRQENSHQNIFYSILI